MDTQQKFYRTVIEMEILSEYEITEDMELEDLVYAITYGDCPGIARIKSSKEVDRKRIVKLLEAQGSDGNFFFCDEDEDFSV